MEAQRLGRHMIGADDPYPELPNPLPRDCPKPDNWAEENVSPDHGEEPRYYDFEGCKRRREQIIPISEINKQSPKTVRHNIDDLIDNVFDTKD